MGDTFNSFLEEWKGFQFSDRRHKNDDQVNQININKNKCLQGRKKLSDLNRQVKNLSPDDLKQKIGAILKQYQDEIDRLNQRSIFAEKEFLDLSQSLFDRPDPVLILEKLPQQLSSAEPSQDSSTLNSEISSLKASLERLESENVQLKESLTKAGNKNDNKNEVPEVDTRFQEEIERLRKETSRLEEQVNTSDGKVKELEEIKKKLSGQIREQAHEIEIFHGERQKLESLTRAVDEYSRENERLKSQALDLQSSSQSGKDVAAENKILKQKLAAAVHEADQLKQRETQMMKQYDDMVDALSTKQSLSNKQLTRIEQQKKEIESLRADLDRQEKKASALLAEKAAVDRQHGDVAGEFERLVDRSTRQADEIALLTKNFERVQAEKEALVKELDRQTTLLNDVREQLSKKSDEAERLARKTATTASRAKVLGAKNSDLLAFIDQLTEKNRQAHEEAQVRALAQQRSLETVEAVARTHAATIQQLRDKNESLESRLEEFEQSKVTEVSRLVEAQAIAGNQTRSVVERLGAKIELLEGENEKLKIANRTLAEDLEAQIQKCDAMTHEFVEEFRKLKESAQAADEEADRKLARKQEHVSRCDSLIRTLTLKNEELIAESEQLRNRTAELLERLDRTESDLGKSTAKAREAEELLRVKTSEANSENDRLRDEIIEVRRDLEKERDRERERHGASLEAGSRLSAEARKNDLLSRENVELREKLRVASNGNPSGGPSSSINGTGPAVFNREIVPGSGPVGQPGPGNDEDGVLCYIPFVSYYASKYWTKNDPKKSLGPPS
eukprot:TRINITY_DN1590_c0_g1_i1.p1 TRINITY_DN1590_c0_g1~~TRINITY_DN1590_c0_g1_i1.p1  ORF type:complete len:800 (+),score=264.36 TRINITY_DN1590_c0_g1_i1:30-2402(+)